MEDLSVNTNLEDTSGYKIMSETTKNLWCVLEVISTKLHLIIVAQKGTYFINTSAGEISGEIQKPMKINHEYNKLVFRLNFSEIPKTSYLPLHSIYIDTRSIKGDTRFAFYNVLVHFDEGSPALDILKNRRKCSFTYNNNFGGVVSNFSCEKFLKPCQGISLIRYFGLPESRICGNSRNHHGMRKIDAIPELDEEKRLEIYEEIPVIFNSIVDKEKNMGTRLKNSFKKKLQMVLYNLEKEKKLCYLEDLPRRKYPIGHFEICRNGPRGAKLVHFLYTIGNRVGGKLRPFVCPISGHLGFAMQIGTSKRKFKTFSKFIKTLTRWAHSCQGTARFKLFMGESPEISFSFNYDPLDSTKGKITILHWDVKARLMNTYECSIAHIAGVFATETSMAPWCNIQNHKEWAERYRCPHQVNCPRNCVGYLPNEAEGRKTRVAIPKSIHCTCSDKDGILQICSKYHYYIELCQEIPIQMGEFFTTMIMDYKQNPKMYEKAPIQVLLKGSLDIIYYIEKFLYGVKI
jgi:hypothetical protein